MARTKKSREPKVITPAGARERLMAALARELATIYRFIGFLADEDVPEDEVVAILGTLAEHPSEDVAPGHERAWMLSTLLRLLGADAGIRRKGDGALPALVPSSPMPGSKAGFSEEDVAQLDGALRELDKQTRAALLLVLHEGLTIDDAVKVQGGSRRAFTRRYAAALTLLDTEVIDRLLGRPSSAPT